MDSVRLLSRAMLLAVLPLIVNAQTQIVQDGCTWIMTISNEEGQYYAGLKSSSECINACRHELADIAHTKIGDRASNYEPCYCQWGHDRTISYHDYETYDDFSCWLTDPGLDDLHWVVAGNPYHKAWNNKPFRECMANDETRASQSSSHRGPDIAVTCCNNDGSVDRKFGNNNKCKRAKTYAEAYDICADRGDGFRLCTYSEMIIGKTKGHGCYNDWRYNWVSDRCFVEGVTNVAAPMDGLAFNEVMGSDGAAASSSNALEPMVIGAAAGAALMVVIVAVVVAMRRRLSAKDSEQEMADAVHVHDGHISQAASATLSVSMDAVEVAANADTEKETEAEVEVVTATEMEAGSRNEC